MNVVGKVGNIIQQGVYSVATPFHPFGGAVDIIVVEQQDGSYRSTPWYVRFGKFQGVLKGAEKNVRILVDGVEAKFHMCLDNSGEAYFIREVDSIKDSGNSQDLKISDSDLSASQDDVVNNGPPCLTENGIPSAEDMESSNENVLLDSDKSGTGEFSDMHTEVSPVSSPGCSAYRYESLDHVESLVNSQSSDSEVVLVSGDGHVLLAPTSSCDTNTDNVQLNTPYFHLYPGEGGEVAIEPLQDSADFTTRNGALSTGDGSWEAGLLGDIIPSTPNGSSKGDHDVCIDEIASKDHDEHSLDDEKLARQAGNSPTAESRCSQDTVFMSRKEIFKSCLEFSELGINIGENDSQNGCLVPLESNEDSVQSLSKKNDASIDLSLEDEKSQSDLETDRCEGLDLHVSDTNDNSDSVPAIHVDVSENGDTDEKIFVDKKDLSGSLEDFSLHQGDNQHGAQGVESSKDCEAVAPREGEVYKSEILEPQAGFSNGRMSTGFEISLCRNLLHSGMGLDSANDVFNAHRISEEEFKASGASLVKNENLIIRFKQRYLPWDKAASIVLGVAAFGLEFPVEPEGAIPVEQDEKPKAVEEDKSALHSTPSRRWRLWPIPFRRNKTLQHSTSNASSDDVFVDSESALESPPAEPSYTEDASNGIPQKKLLRTNIPTSEEIASLNLKDGQNKIAFSFSTRVLGEQQVDAHIYLWKWNTRIVISDVDGTITKSDVLGQFMPLFGKDWTQSGVARLFSAIKENGYQLLFLSARAIVQAYLTRSFLLNLKQDGKALPNGPVVISPNGLIPSLYREVIRRKPHEFKIACLEDIKSLFPAGYNPFYAGFGNRDTDEISYRKIGIPKGKIFIINPKGEVAIHRCIDAKSYTSLHTLVNDMFPPTSLAEQEDFNSWNYWRTPLPIIDC